MESLINIEAVKEKTLDKMRNIVLEIINNSSDTTVKVAALKLLESSCSPNSSFVNCTFTSDQMKMIERTIKNEKSSRRKPSSKK